MNPNPGGGLQNPKFAFYHLGLSLIFLYRILLVFHQFLFFFKYSLILPFCAISFKIDNYWFWFNHSGPENNHLIQGIVNKEEKRSIKLHYIGRSHSEYKSRCCCCSFCAFFCNPENCFVFHWKE